MRWLLFLGVFALLGVSCGGGSETSDSTDADILIEAEPTPSTFDPSDPDQLAGVSTNPSNIEAGDCFNEYVYQDSADLLQQVTTLVGCNGPHDREAYFLAEYPADEDAPMPPDETMQRWALSACLEEFENFVGLEYVLSELEIGAIVPSFEGWTENGDRTVVCFVFPDEPGFRLRSPVFNSGL